MILDKGSFVGIHIPAPWFAYDIGKPEFDSEMNQILIRLISAQNPSCVIPSETGWFIGIPRFTGWWFQPTPLKNITVVSWDDDIPNWMEKLKKIQTTNQFKIWINHIPQ